MIAYSSTLSVSRLASLRSLSEHLKYTFDLAGTCAKPITYVSSKGPNTDWRSVCVSGWEGEYWGKWLALKRTDCSYRMWRRNFMADRLGAGVREGSNCGPAWTPLVPICWEWTALIFYSSIISSFRQSALISALSSQVHKSFNPKEALSEENLHGAWTELAVTMLGCCECLPRQCYVVARAFRVVFSVLLFGF